MRWEVTTPSAGVDPRIQCAPRGGSLLDPKIPPPGDVLTNEMVDMADEGFHDDAVDAGEVNAGQTVTVLYELSLLPGAGPLGTVRVHYLDAEFGTADEVQREIGAAGRQSFEEASRPFQATVLAARFAEHLRKSRWIPRSESLQDVLDLAGALPPATAGSSEAKGLVTLIRDAVRLSSTPE